MSRDVLLFGMILRERIISEATGICKEKTLPILKRMGVEITPRVERLVEEEVHRLFTSREKEYDDIRLAQLEGRITFEDECYIVADNVKVLMRKETP